jgi:hypothetical protein
MALWVFGQNVVNAMNLWILWNFWGYIYGWQLSDESLHIAFGFTVDELKGFWDFSLALGMLLATVNAAEFAQNYLPKVVWETLKCHQNLKFWLFQKK